MIHRILIWIPAVLLLGVCVGCSESADQKRENAVESARINLSARKCDAAISTLEEAGRDLTNADYVKTLATAYACKGGYSTTVFYGDNLEKLAYTQDSLLGSLTTFSSSLMTAPTESTYVNLWTAFELLTKAGNVVAASASERAAVFTSNEAADINILALYMNLTLLGRYLFYYGNADPTTGVKGGGSSANGNPNNLTNGCLYNYDPENSVLASLISAARASGELGSCTATATGHPQLVALPNVNTIARMCEGIVLFNQLVDIALGMVLPNGDIASLEEVTSQISELCADSAYTGNICNVKTRSECEDLYGSGVETDTLQAYFFLIFETLFQ